MQQNYLRNFLLLLFAFCTWQIQAQTTVTLSAVKDNSIYSENNNSNGSGNHLFVGRTQPQNNSAVRRALIQFDISSIPAGSTITAVQLNLTGNRGGASSANAHRLTSDWGESTSDAAGQEGRGTAAAAGDATWNFNFSDNSSWTSAGGDFVASASASTSVGSGTVSTWEGSNMVADVQAWLDGTADNFGWILIGDENTDGSAVRLASRENSAGSPTLSITFESACDADGGTIALNDGSTEITICAGDGESDAFDVTLEGNVGSNSAWVITDDQGNILALPAAPPFDLDGAGPGICLVWHLSFEDGLTGAEVGNNASDLMGCFDLSNSITVNRNQPEGGDLALTDGSTEITICAGDDVSDAFDVVLTNNSGGNSAWVITDDQGNILALPAAPPFDLDGAGPGVCLVWHLSFEDGLTGAEVGNNASDLMGCFDLSNSITVNRNQPEGGDIILADGTTEITICAGDGESDAFEVGLTNNSGGNSAWVITDDQGNILALPAAPPFDLEGAGPGICLIWHLSFEDGLTGAEVGNNASDLMGCFDLSNPITVNRQGVNGGNLALEDGSTEITICAGDDISDAFNVVLTDTIGSNSAWVITDDQGNILALPMAPPFDLDGAGPGVCLVWHLSFEDGLTGAEVGNNASDLMGCFDLSNPITVNRNQPEGGDIILADGTTEITICAGDGESDAFEVGLTNNSGGNSAWVITDDQGNILALPAAPPFDLEGAGPGICLVWHLSFEDGLTGAEVGNNASDLMGCFDLSNPITVNREGVNGGNLALEDGSTEITICAGDGMSDAFNVVLTDTVGSNSAWVITDDQGNILALPAAPPFDLEGAGPGVCLVWHLSFEDGLTGAEVGNNASDLMGCFDLSNPITVDRQGVNGGNLALEDGSTEITICAGDGMPDAFNVVLTDTLGSNSAWVITDDQGNILALPAAPPFDLEGAGPGICLVWHLSFEDGLTGAEVGNNASDLMGCFDLSNPITVNRQGVNGGNLALEDGTTEITICAGDDMSDAFNVVLTDTVGSNFAWVITDDQGEILALPMAPPFDLDGAGPGICLVWHLSFEDGLTGAEVGNNASDLMGCFDLSNPITVNRIEDSGPLDGGMIALTDGSTDLTICAGDGISDSFDVTLVNNEGANSAWVITDDQGNILGLPMAPPFDLDGAGPGVCLVWHLSFLDGLQGAEVGQNANDLQGCFDLSNPITVTRNQPDGGRLTLANGDTTIAICAGDDMGDAFDVSLTDNRGSNSAWVITDDQGNILALPMAPPFDLDGAGPGICLVWHLSFEDGLTGAEVGNNASDLMGCFDLSNPISVNRIEADSTLNGGNIALTDGSTEITICAGDGMSDAFDVTLADNAGMNSAWVITDDQGNILGLPAAPPFDLDGAGPGICLVWHLSFSDGLVGAEVGKNANDLQGCFDLSNPITVNREGVNGGNLALEDGSTEITICAGDGMSDAFNVVLTDTVGSNSAWVITDDQGNILALPASPPFDLDGAGPGICLVWHLSFEDGLTGAEVGNNASDLMGCFDLSNPITVNRQGVDGGTLTGGPFAFCVGDGEADMLEEGAITLEGNIGTNSAWVVTDEQGNILGLPASPSDVDFDDAGAGICLIWHLSFEDGLTGAEMGNNASDLMGCFDLSNPITVTRDTTGEICITSTTVLQTEEVQFELFPNPANGEINIRAQLNERPEALFIEVRSVVGQTLIRRSLDNQTTINERLNVNNLPQGMYFLTLSTGDAIVTERFLKR